MNGSLYIRGHPLLILQGSVKPSTSLIFSFSSFLALVAAQGLFASRSAPSPSWPLRQFGAFYFSFSPITPFFFFFASEAASVLDPEWVLRLLRMSYKFGMYRKTLLGNKHCYVMSNTFFVLLIKLLFFIILVPYCNYAWIFCNSVKLRLLGYYKTD